jgi:hypothetical protein
MGYTNETFSVRETPQRLPNFQNSSSWITGCKCLTLRGTINSCNPMIRVAKTVFNDIDGTRGRAIHIVVVREAGHQNTC